MEGSPRCRHRSTISRAETRLPSASSGGTWEISLFWHHRQERLQPVQLKERQKVPGMNRFSGFFSTGSTAMAQGRP